MALLALTCWLQTNEGSKYFTKSIYIVTRISNQFCFMPFFLSLPSCLMWPMNYLSANAPV